MVGCAMRTKMPTGRYFHGAHNKHRHPKFKKNSAIIQLSKNEEVVLIDLIEACDHAVLCEKASFILSRQ